MQAYRDLRSQTREARSRVLQGSGDLSVYCPDLFVNCGAQPYEATLLIYHCFLAPAEAAAAAALPHAHCLGAVSLLYNQL